MLKKSLAGLAVIGALGGCALPPQGIGSESLAAFDAAVASLECELVTESDSLAVQLQTGLSAEQVQEVAGYRLGLDQAVALEGGGIRLVTGACAPQATAPAPAAEG